jgi:hypothetical protein
MPLLPGFGSAPAAPAAPPPPPTTADPAIKDAQDKLRMSEKRRKGRSATILTDDQSGLGTASVSRPEARGVSKLLGE